MSIAISLLLLSVFLLQTNDAALSTNLQNLELDDLTSLWEKFPSIINKIQEAVNRFRCPKGWRRLGGSCYYLSNLTSTPFEANETCHALHSNQSNLMQIRNTIELFYAAHVLTKNNLSALMIELDPTAFRGKSITEMLMDDQGRWQRMKEKFRELRAKYHRVKEKIIDELHSAGLKISRRSRKMKQSFKRRKEELFDPEFELEMENSTVEYEYDDFESSDENDEFDHLDEISGICDQIDWNVLNNASNVYLLTTYLINDKIVCSISDIEVDLEYDHLCEYVLDFCFANVVCGQHGRCVNTLSGFKCSCGFLYGGLLCEKISRQGYQIIIGIVIVIVLYSLSFKPVRWLIWSLYSGLIGLCKRQFRKSAQKRRQKKGRVEDDRKNLVMQQKMEEPDAPMDLTERSERRPTIAEEILDFIQEIFDCLTFPQTPDPLQKPIKRDLVRLFWVGGLSIFFLSTLFIVTTTIHFTSFKYDLTDETNIEVITNETTRLVARCDKISDYKIGNLIFFPVAFSLILIFSWSVKREKKCLKLFDGRPGLIPPIEPFRTANRFTTATVFGILAFEVLKIFEELLFSTGDPISHGVLVELFLRIAIVLLVGLRYYPILASLQLRNVVARFFVCLYILADMAYAIIREGSCMGFIPISRYYSTIEEAKLRMELGTWFVIYGLIKNTPHFIFLSYIGAELFVRFGYDSIYVPMKKESSVWSAPMAQLDEFRFAKYYVTKLFRKNLRSYRRKKSSLKVDQNDLVDHEHENFLQQRRERSRLRWFFRQIYPWDDHFRFTTMATCTYTVAIVFLYYLACTFVFLYVSRTTGHLSFLRFYIESILNIELKGIFSLRYEITFSAIFTVILFAFQLFLGMKNYKRHRLQLYQGIYVEVPSPDNFKANAIASKSVHYSGFLVGYMAWGFVICFHLVLVITSAARILTLRMRYVEMILAIVVPVSVIYLIKMVGTSSAGKSLFIPETDDQLNLKNRKCYAIFVYFNFFADCFLGIASCIIRLIKATFLNIVYMARLDCSFLGRPLERYDLGYAAYVSYLHMEVAHTNPVMLAFCYSMYEDVVARRPKHCYDDECCIAPGELDDEECIQQREREEQMKILREEESSKNERKKPKKNKRVSPTIDEIDEETKTEGESPSPPSTITRSEASNGHEKGSTIARLIPEERPRLPPPSAPEPEVPQRTDLPVENDDDDDDDDGGLKPPSISTIARVIPSEPPRLLPMQGSSEAPPPVPRRQDADDEDDDGGIDPQVIAKQKQELEAKRKKKEEEKKKKEEMAARARAEEDDDDDGGVKVKKDPKKPKKKTKSPSVRPKPDDDEDEDGGVSKQIQLEKEKKRKALEAKQKKKQTKVKLDDPDEDDDGAVRRPSPSTTRKASPKKKKPPKRIPEQDDDVDDDGGRMVKSYNTIARAIPMKQPVLDHQTEKHKEPSPEILDDGSMLTTAPKQKSSTHDTVAQILPHFSTDVLKSSSKATPSETHYDTIPTEEERAARASYASYSPPSYDQMSNNSSLQLLRTISYREAQQSTPPIVQRRSTTVSLSNRSQSNTNEEDSHYSEITNPSAGIVNRSYSNNGSNYSLKQSSKQSSPEETVPEEEEETEDTQVESEEEEAPARKPRSPIPNQSTSFAVISHLVDAKKAEEMLKLRKRKQARFRWFLAYTILNNYHLFDLRKQVQSRLAILRIHRSNLIDEQKHVPQVQPVTISAMSEASTAGSVRQRKMAAQPTPIVPPVRLLSVPGPVIDDFPQSPAERYITIRSCMLYDTNGQPSTLSQAPSVISQITPSQKRSVGFSAASTAQRPILQRETLPMGASANANGTPIFQPVPDSVQSTADYPMTNASTVTNLSTLRTQMSHAQHMQAWRQEKIKKIQKKQSHSYFYGSPTKKAMDEKIATAAILTPLVIVTGPSEMRSPDGQRMPSNSPFQRLSVQKSDRKNKQTASSDETPTKASKNGNDSESHRSNGSEV